MSRGPTFWALLFLAAVPSGAISLGISRAVKERAEAVAAEKKARPPGPETIIVHAGAASGRVPAIGLLHGLTYNPATDYTTTTSLISALKPRTWRLDNLSNDVYGYVDAENFVGNFGTKVIFNVQAAVHNQYGFDIRISPTCPTGQSHCFKTFGILKASWTLVAQGVANGVFSSGEPISRFEVFAEPVVGPFGSPQSGTGLEGITGSQLLELYKVTHDAIRAILPAARIGGPGWIGYNNDVFTAFLDYVVAEGLTLDFLSWHEFGAPSAVAAHAAAARALIAARPALCAPACPELHVGEFSPPEQQHVPGAALGWLYFLDEARIDASNRACFDVLDSGGDYNGCFEGFSGLLTRGNNAPSDVYWVFRRYVGLDKTRLQVEVSRPGTVAIADRDDALDQIRVLVGRYGYNGAAGRVTLTVEGYPYGAGPVNVDIERIPALGQIYHVKRLDNPQVLPSTTAAVQGGRITLSVNNVKDGDVYLLTLRP